MRYRLSVDYMGHHSAIFETSDAGETYMEIWCTENPKYRIDWVYGLTGTEFEFSSDRVKEFLEDRVPARNRLNLDQILKELKLDCWDPLAIIQKTGGKSPSDFYTINVEEIAE